MLVIDAADLGGDTGSDRPVRGRGDGRISEELAPAHRSRSGSDRSARHGAAPGLPAGSASAAVHSTRPHRLERDALGSGGRGDARGRPPGARPASALEALESPHRHPGPGRAARSFAVEPPQPGRSGGLGGGVAAILSELVTLLERLAEATSAAIDLRSLPMSPQDRAELRARARRRRSAGDGRLRKAYRKFARRAYPGVWWVEHSRPARRTDCRIDRSEPVPQILASASDEIAAAARDLRAQITASRARGRARSNHGSHRG